MATPQAPAPLPNNFPLHLPCPACSRDCDVTRNQALGVVLHVCLKCGELLAFLAVGDRPTPTLVRPTPDQLQILQGDVHRYRAALRISRSVKHFRLWAPTGKDRKQ